MACTFCHSDNQRWFPSEINIHPPHGLERIDEPSVWAFPALLVCQDCGFSEFVLSSNELRSLNESYPPYEEATGRRFGT